MLFFILLSWRNKGSHFFGGELLWTGTLLSFTLFWRTQNAIHTSFNTHIKPYQFDESRLKHFTFTSYFPFPRKKLYSFIPLPHVLFLFSKCKIFSSHDISEFKKDRRFEWFGHTTYRPVGWKKLCDCKNLTLFYPFHVSPLFSCSILPVLLNPALLENEMIRWRSTLFF